MKRNFESTGPNWTNEQVFERWGDDNTVYFMNVPDQLMLMTQPFPLDMDPMGDGNGNRSFKDHLIVAPQGQQVTSFLCQESSNTTRTFLLPPGSSAKVFLDAWSHYQTVPFLVTAAGENGAPVKYAWYLTNYLPIPTHGANATSGEGITESGAVCPPSMNGSVESGEFVKFYKYGCFEINKRVFFRFGSTHFENFGSYKPKPKRRIPCVTKDKR